MSTAVATTLDLTPEERALLTGDLSKLTSDQRASLIASVCRSVGLNPLTQPFAYITLNGKLTLYARKDATDQLRALRNVSLRIDSKEQIGDLYVVCVSAMLPNGRTDSEIGAVNAAGLRGEALANAMMKAITKAKRRATLSICGLGFLDETEVETIPGAQVWQEQAAPPRQITRTVDTTTGEITDPPATATRVPAKDQPAPKEWMDTLWDLYRTSQLYHIRVQEPPASLTKGAAAEMKHRLEALIAEAEEQAKESPL